MTIKDQALVHMNQALDWAYENAQVPIPALGLDSPVDLAESYLKSEKGDHEKAIDSLINWYTAYAGSVGFVSNLGGLMTMPVSIPANVASIFMLQFRLILAIAYLRGHSSKEEYVKAFAFISLTGSGAADTLKDFGINFALKYSQVLISKISGATLRKINQAVGFRLVAKTGEKSLINLTKIVPFIGGIVGGTLDATLTYAVGNAAKTVFKPFNDEEPSELQHVDS